MSSEIIGLIIFLVSVISLVVFIWRKIPALCETVVIEKTSDKSTFCELRDRVLGLPGIRSFSFEIFLQRMISHIRILSLKTDQKTFSWLQQLREKNQKKRLEDDNYWEEIENLTDKK